MRAPAKALLTFSLVLALLLGCWIWFKRSSTPPYTPLERMTLQLSALQAQEQAFKTSLYSDEVRAQSFFHLVEQLWQELYAHNSDRLEILATFLEENLSFSSLREAILPHFLSQSALPHDILQYHQAERRPITLKALQQTLRSFHSQGWQLERCEFRHIQFLPLGNGRWRSKIYFAAQLTIPSPEKRASLEGEWLIEWAEKGGTPLLLRLDASHLALHTREGPVPFRQHLELELKPPQGSYFIDPLLVYDLDHDGYSEIILAAANQVLRRQPNGTYALERLCSEDLQLIFTAILGDFDRNGRTDLLTLRKEGLYLYESSQDGRFTAPSRQVWAAHPRISYGQVMTAGDYDGDGDLDLWIGQYKPPYSQGQMPAPYYDANDGYPSFLLENDGQGRFRDASHSSGLGDKRWRRVYSASFIDLDRDGDLDLLVVSDFAGVDAYENQGRGLFKDVSEKWFPEGKAFGMAHLFSDFNSDGLLDFFMIGMNSPTVDRLTHLGLVRPGANDFKQRHQITFGNRLYLGTTNGFTQVELPSIHRTGWSWGAAAFDADNDGFPDLYLANGHESQQLVREYEPEFWLHDIYVASSQTSIVHTAYFRSKFEQTRMRGFSYGGYDINRFYLNARGTNFFEVAHLLGIASQADSRNVVADDLDKDGRVDLIFTTFEVFPRNRQVVYIYLNMLPQVGSWIGLQSSSTANPAFLNQQILFESGELRQSRTITTGDGYRSQAPLSFHVGLGNKTNDVSIQFSPASTNSAQFLPLTPNQWHQQ